VTRYVLSAHSAPDDVREPPTLQHTDQHADNERCKRPERHEPHAGGHPEYLVVCLGRKDRDADGWPALFCDKPPLTRSFLAV
jgi:hypothetical protein